MLTAQGACASGSLDPVSSVVEAVQFNAAAVPRKAIACAV